MTFKKQFTKEDFLNVLSSDWQKTRDIAEKIGCKRDNVTNNLLAIPDEVEWQWTKGGKQGTREWRKKQ